jgi:hypothetical protein
MSIMREESRKMWWSRHRFAIGLTVVLVFSAAARLYQIDGFSSNFDEGVHLMVAWLLTRGFPLYTEVMTVQLPMLFQPTAWLFALWGPSSTAARCLEVGYTLLGIAAIAYAGRLLWRPATGLVAALFLSLEVLYFIYSRVFVGTVSAAAVGAVAVLGALYFQATGRRRWLLLAGAALSFSLLIKPLSLSVGLLLVWVIIARRRSEMPATASGRQVLLSFPWRAALLDCLYLGAIGLILPLLCLVFYDGPAMLRQVVSVQSTRFSGRSDYLRGFLAEYLRNNLPVLLLAAWGTIQTIRRRSSLGVTVIVWLVLNFVFIVVTQAQRHHLVLLDLPLALLAAQPVGELINLARTRRLQPRPWSSLAAASLLIYYLVTLPALPTLYLAEHPRGSGRPEDEDRRAAVRLLQKVTTPDQFIISDDQELVFEARRMALPELVDTSHVVINSGVLTDQAIMQLADQQAAAFIFWTRRLELFPTLPVWALSTFTKSKEFDNHHVILYDKQTPQVTHLLDLTFSGEIALAGYDLSQDTPPKVTLYWRRLGVQIGDYQATLRLLDTAGKAVAQRDYLPLGFDGHFHTTAWPVDVLLRDKTSLPPTDDLPPGEYTLAVGLYDPAKRELLPAAGGSARNNLAWLEVITLGNR